MPLLPEFAAVPELKALAERAERLANLLDAPLSAATDVPKPEHPRPQCHRPTWLNLNGTWEFEIDAGDTGRERGLLDRPLEGSILVPFAPESEASGVEHTDFMEAVWYRREIEIPAEWADGPAGEPLFPVLHFGAVDHDATVWVNGVEVARHRGGFTPFHANLRGVARPGDTATIVVRARDSRWDAQARGKQATWHDSTHCQYTRTTGIWQTVWLEGVPAHAIRAVRATPSLADHSLDITLPLTHNTKGTRVEVTVGTPEGAPLATASARADLDLAPRVRVAIPEEHVRIWATGEPELYSVKARLLDSDGGLIDEVHSYAGLRSTALEGTEFRINGERVFQRLVLDQGYWAETLMTAPSDEAMLTDIQIALAAGFNGARLHQKVFEERMLFFSDLYGYLVWGEFGDWGVSGRGPLGYNQEPTSSFVAQWIEALERDFSHPSIVGWCPLNETHQVLHDRITVLDDVTHAMYNATKLADPSRPVIDASGYSHRVRGADIYDSHSYEQDPEAFAREQAPLAEGKPQVNRRELAPNEMPFADGHFSVPYEGQPFFVSEYGGIWWNEQEARAAEFTGQDQAESWGYGNRVRSEEELYERFEALTNVLLTNPLMFGYCYTQLTDVFQEKNGVVDFDRGSKLDLARLRAVQTAKAAYEE